MKRRAGKTVLPSSTYIDLNSQGVCDPKPRDLLIKSAGPLRNRPGKSLEYCKNGEPSRARTCDPLIKSLNL
ncbi:MAG: hypothetical protein QOH41_3247 [Blastocatellia bacterium]|jgi:hypothetical protein|nr:hypothetical protein [Blastocatellia bacterium]